MQTPRLRGDACGFSDPTAIWCRRHQRYANSTQTHWKVKAPHLSLARMPSEARKTTAETGLALMKRLFRALLSQLHPGHSGTLPQGLERKDLRRGPEYYFRLLTGVGKGYGFAWSFES
jgi:hypothetical protein